MGRVAFYPFLVERRADHFANDNEPSPCGMRAVGHAGNDRLKMTPLQVRDWYLSHVSGAVSTTCWRKKASAIRPSRMRVHSSAPFHSGLVVM
jgi:hypothetical protein